MTAVGVASPMAHGQAITSTATILINARVNWETAGLTVTGNTNPESKHSGSDHRRYEHCRDLICQLLDGRLASWASSTRRMICASAVSRPTFVASYLISPSLLSVAPMTGSPVPFRLAAILR